MGLLSHRIERREIVVGDHIYTWRTAFTYSHHGIYVGGSKVVHFTVDQHTGGRGDSPLSSFGVSSGSSFNISDSRSNVESACPTFPDCGFRQPKSGVVLSCLDCFLGTGSLYRFEYGVSSTMFVVKLRGGSTTAESDSPDEVIHRAMYLLQNGFGNYDVFKNNCEDFALYCKTGILIPDQTALGRSGQAACVIGAPLAAMLSSPLKLFMSSPVGVVTATAGMYCMSRYAADIGVRTDVMKMSVEDIALYHGWEEPKEVVTDDDESCEGQVLVDHMDGPASKRQRHR